MTVKHRAMGRSKPRMNQVESTATDWPAMASQRNRTSVSRRRRRA